MADTNEPVYEDIEATAVESEDSQSELDRATFELEELTPEGYLEIINYIQAMEQQVKLPEAGGVSWTTLYGQHGGQLNVTARGVDATQAVKGLFKAVAYAINEYPQMGFRTAPWGNKPAPIHATTTVPATAPATAPAPAPAPVPARETTPQPAQVTRTSTPVAPDDGAPNIETIQVVSVSHGLTKTGIHHLKVKGGRWTKHGFTAYPEVIPQSIGFEEWQFGIDYAPPPELAYAVIDHDQKKIIAFEQGE